MVLRQKTPAEKSKFKVYVKFPLGSTIVTFHDPKTYRAYTQNYKNVKEFIANTSPEQLAKWIKEGKLSIKDMHITPELVYRFNKNLKTLTLIKNIKDSGIQSYMKNAKIAVLSKRSNKGIKGASNEGSPKKRIQVLTDKEKKELMTRMLLGAVQTRLTELNIPNKRIKMALKALNKELSPVVAYAFENKQNIIVLTKVFEEHSTSASSKKNYGLELLIGNGTKKRLPITTKISIATGVTQVLHPGPHKGSVPVIFTGNEVEKYTVELKYSKYSNDYNFAEKINYLVSSK